jgi:outer membrane receptor for monomeric catechols
MLIRSNSSSGRLSRIGTSSPVPECNDRQCGRPAPVERSLDYGLASDQVLPVDDILTARLEHDFNRNLSISEMIRVSNYAFDDRFNGPNFGKDILTPNEPLSQITVGRDRPRDL